MWGMVPAGGMTLVSTAGICYTTRLPQSDNLCKSAPRLLVSCPHYRLSFRLWPRPSLTHAPMLVSHLFFASM
ncbi:uncharacterized protein EV422DRAFT_534046, partial [Fimicolochytrium jonesii]|uniref:uncharacterized protein n=1 Tax=Fimicolochytrium jonesii TaxID=1396493 RepID=UPI0022FE81CE